MRVRSFAATYEPLNIFYIFFYFNPKSHPPVEPLWCKNHENPREEKMEMISFHLILLFYVPVKNKYTLKQHVKLVHEKKKGQYRSN